MAATDQFTKDAHCHCLSVIFRGKHNYSAPTERKDFCHEALFGGITSKCDGRNWIMRVTSAAASQTQRKRAENMARWAARKHDCREREWEQKQGVATKQLIESFQLLGFQAARICFVSTFSAEHEVRSIRCPTCNLFAVAVLWVKC